MTKKGYWIAPLILGVFSVWPTEMVIAQDSLKSLYIPGPKAVCGHSVDEKQQFQQEVSEAIILVESWYAHPPATDEAKLKEQALKNAGLTSSEAKTLEEMSEEDQEAAAMKMAQEVMAGALSAPDQANMESLIKQMEATSQMLSDINTIENLLGPIHMDLIRLENEAAAWHDQHLKPLYDSLYTLEGPAYDQMKKCIMAEEKNYCSLFSTRNLTLIQKEVKALEEASPTIKRLYQGNPVQGTLGASAPNKESDPVWLYLKAIEKSYDYWMDETHWEIGG